LTYRPGGKKPPVFIGLGAVYNRKFEHSFQGPYIPAFLRIGFKNFLALSYHKNALKLQIKKEKGQSFTVNRCKY